MPRGDIASTNEEPLVTAETPARLGVPLTDREMEVLRLVADGLSDIEIGRKLFISEDTVKTHNRRLFRKLGTNCRAGAVAIAYRTGLLTDVPAPPPPEPPPAPEPQVVVRTDPRVWRLAEAVRRWECRFSGAVLPPCAQILHHLVVEALKET